MVDPSARIHKPSKPLLTTLALLLMWGGGFGGSLFGQPAQADPQTAPGTLTVSAGAADRDGTIVQVPCTLRQLLGAEAPVLPADRPACVRLVPVGSASSSSELIAQWTADAPANLDTAIGTLVFRLASPLTAGQTRTYRIEAIQPARYPADRMTVKHITGDGITVFRGQKPVLKYHTGIVRCPDRSKPWMDRTGYAHPLWTPAGAIVTDDFSPDHLHQRGLFIALRHAEWGGQKGDFWNLADKSGVIRHAAVGRLISGPVFAEFSVRNIGWFIRKSDGRQTPILHETWHTRIYDVGEDAYLYDVCIRHEALGQDIKLPKFKYGGFAYRGARAWTKSAPDILTSEGRQRDGDNHPARWCRFGGTLDNAPVSTTIFDHSSNPRYPNQLLRIHPAMPYYCFPVAKSGDFVIEVGKPRYLRYRVYVTDSLPAPAKLEAIAKDFTDPPVVKLAS